MNLFLFIKLGKYNADKMKEILGIIKKKYCSTCDLGAPSKLIGYKSSGTCLDYIYDKLKVPYSLAWEIFTNEREFVELKDYLRKKENINNNNSNSKCKQNFIFF